MQTLGSTPTTLLWEQEINLLQLAEIAARVAECLATESRFCLWLTGDLGSGKTTLTGEILRQLGLDARIPVTSPTFTYINEYSLKDKNGSQHWYAHLDLYRLGDDASLEELGLADSRDFRGYFVEWPEVLPGDYLIQPTHRMDIAYGKNADSPTRVYRFFT